jgi:predicted deacylase
MPGSMSGRREEGAAARQAVGDRRTARRRDVYPEMAKKDAAGLFKFLASRGAIDDAVALARSRALPCRSTISR